MTGSRLPDRGRRRGAPVEQPENTIEAFELAVRLDSSVPPVLADPNQLQQVLLNLAVNARDAMPDGGSIGITLHVEGEEAVVVEG